MGMKYTHVVVCLGALIALKATLPAAPAPQSAVAQTRNCPEAHDQFVGVSGGAVAFRLHIDNPDDSRISIFQYPLGGILEQAGPTNLDYVFVPSADFRGTTTFTYRLIPPLGCTRSTQLGRVTLAGGPLPGGSIDTAPSGLAPPPETPATCGVLPLPLFASAGAMGFAVCRRMRGTIRSRCLRKQNASADHRP
ncbi:MAG: hypothetical protein HBSAPP02_24280 [Phycisphaerae bacterium]|nr:MAG: hypothetical protein HRU71_14455 [Planctomycetia bacterium]GJQ27396.1 MAG: hypothetical protein HBSAPP02_24280 [Phycisphaerae bacterium]